MYHFYPGISFLKKLVSSFILMGERTTHFFVIFVSYSETYIGLGS